jgi:two-component system NtrC family response regulator
MANILLVDDDPGFREGLAETLGDLGHRTVEVNAGERALDLLSDAKPNGGAEFDMAFLDLRMPGMDGLETLRRLRTQSGCRELPVVVLTAHADTENTIEAMKLGAFDHLTKPITRDQIREVLARGLSRPRERSAPKSRADSSSTDHLIGVSGPMREVQKLIGLAAPSEATVLIQGETGTGKEEIARALHRHGSRAAGPFMPVNCAAIPADLLESELFGHVRGAFTGAVNARAGKFAEANNGTLFLDEIGDMPPFMQAKILRVLQDREVTPVGGREARPVDVRVVAATHRDLVAMVHEGSFREDLFYRLNVVRITAPPLRERGSDILVLAEHFLSELGPPGSTVKRLTPAAAQALLSHAWPGNVRELRNLMEQATVTVRSSVIDRGDLALAPAAMGPQDTLDSLLALPYAEAIARLEKLLLERALRASGGNRAEAARRLGIRRQLLYARLREAEIKEDEAAAE